MARTFSTATQTTADLEANASLAKALSPYAAANRVLVQTAMTEQGKNWRAAVKAIETFNNAINTGSASTYMRALVDLAALPLENAPAATDLLSNVEKVRQLQQNLGKDPTNPAIAAQIWQTLTVQKPGGAQAYGNVQELKRITGIQDDAAVLEMLQRNGTDSYAYGIVEQTLNQAKMQQAAIDHQRGLQANLATTSAQDLIAQYYPNEVPEDVARRWKDANKGPLLSARSQVGMNNLLKISNEEANRKPELTGIAKDTYDFNVEMQKQLLAQTTTESDRDRAAKLINSPMFREWAQSNGFDIGHIEEPDPNREYAPGELTTSGVYVPGRDDYKAVMLAQRQLGMDPNKAHPFMAKGAGIKGELKKYGALDVQLAPPSGAPAPAAAPEPPAAEEFTDAAGWTYRLYNGEVSVIGGPKGVKTEATLANPLPLPPETAKKALSEWFSDGTGVDVSADVEAALNGSKAPAPTPSAPAAEPASEKVYGAIGRKFGNDPMGSVRLNGQLYLKDESTGKFYRAPEPETGVAGETITSAQGPNALKAFAEEVRARRASNIARRLEDKEGGAKAPLRAAAIGLAQTLTPERQTEAEKARAAEYNRQQEMGRRAQEQVVTEAPTTPQEALLRAQNKWNTTNADQGYLGREDESATADVPITSVPSASYGPNATVPNALAGTGTGIGSTRVAATPRADMQTEREIVQAEKDRAAARTANIPIKPQPSPPLSPERTKAQEANVQAWLAENPAGAPIKTPPPKERPSPPLSPERAKAQEANVRRDLAASANTAPSKPESQRQALLEQKPQYRDLLTVPTAKSTNTPSPATTQYAR